MGDVQCDGVKEGDRLQCHCVRFGLVRLSWEIRESWACVVSKGNRDEARFCQRNISFILRKLGPSMAMNKRGTLSEAGF